MNDIGGGDLEVATAAVRRRRGASALATVVIGRHDAAVKTTVVGDAGAEAAVAAALAAARAAAGTARLVACSSTKSLYQ